MTLFISYFNWLTSFFSFPFPHQIMHLTKCPQPNLPFHQLSSGQKQKLEAKNLRYDMHKQTTVLKDRRIHLTLKNKNKKFESVCFIIHSCKPLLDDGNGFTWIITAMVNPKAQYNVCASLPFLPDIIREHILAFSKPP